MDTVYKTYRHNPPHLFVPQSKYFITSSTLGRYPYLKSENAKKIAFKYISKSLVVYKWKLEDWVILNNHIHLMVEAPKNAISLSKVMNNFHRFTSIWLSKNQIIKKDKKYFHNYWDTCITYENSYFARLNYIWFNPVKHGYVQEPEDWKFGSYFYRYKEEKRKLKLLEKKYPFNKVKVEDDF